MKLLEEIYYSDMNGGNRPASYWQERREVGERREQYRAELLDGLDNSQKELFQKFEKYFSDTAMIDERYSFFSGFRLAVRMITECFIES